METGNGGDGSGKKKDKGSEGEIAVVEETELDDFYIYCPVCGAHVARLSVSEGDVEEFRTPCQECDSELSSYSAVAVPLDHLPGEGFEETLKEHVISYWESTLEDRVTETEKETGPMGPKYEEHEIVEEVDYTEEYAEVFFREAQSFGWDWKPEKVVPARINENNSYKNLETDEIYNIISVEDAPEGGEREVRAVIESDGEEENASMAMSEFKEFIEDKKLVRVFEGESYLM